MPGALQEGPKLREATFEPRVSGLSGKIQFFSLSGKICLGEVNMQHAYAN